MKKEDVIVLIQLLSSMKEAAKSLEEAYIKEDMEKLNAIKKEILALQKEVDELL